MAKPTRFRNKWRIRWTDENGKRHSAVYETHKEAASQLKLHESQIEEIKLGLRSPTPADRKFDELCDYWLEKVLPQKRFQESDKSIIRKHLRPAFGGILIREIGRMQIDDFQAQRLHLDKKTINNQLTLLISMLNVAVELGWLLKSPRIKKPKVRIFSEDFRYLKTNEEIDRFLRCAHEEGEEVFMLYATAIYTGMRAGELAALERDDIDFKNRIIVVQRSFNGPTKAEDVRHVLITDPLLPLLRTWLIKRPGKLIFQNEAGHMHQESARIFQEALHRVLKRAGFPTVMRKGKERRYLRFHDLRHTFASHWVMNGGDIFKLQKLLGHKSIQMTQRYSHLAPNAFAGDYGRLGTQAPSGPSQVISLEIKAQ